MQHTEETYSLVANAAAAFVAPDGGRVRRVRDSAGGHDAERWSAMAAQGWTAMLLPESCGGTDLGVRAALIIAERLGYGCDTAPFVPAAMAAVQCLLDCPPGAARQALMDGIASGALVMSPAWPCHEFPDAASTEPAAVQDRGHIVLDGSVRFVPVAQAGRFITSARLDGRRVLLDVPADTPGLDIVPEKRADGSCGAWLHFTQARVPQAALLAQGEEARAALQAAESVAILGTSAELLGLMERSLELTRDYLCVRQQFGQTIGSFQALQHRAVDMWMQKELTRAALRSALQAFLDSGSTPQARRIAAHSAKARAAQAALYVAAQSVQLHGAIGMTDEYELGVYVNRILALLPQWGTAAQHRRSYGALIAEQGGAEAELPAPAGPAAEDTMDFNAMDDSVFRAMVRHDFETHYPDHLRYPARRLHWSELRDWYARISRKGWIAPAWPREHGGMGLSTSKLLIFLEEQERWGIARYPDQGVLMVGPVLMRYGTEAQRRKFLPGIVRCDHIWCQGYSEPGAGSDLASLRTRAVQVPGPDGPEFSITGQKIWTTLAQDSTHIYVLARTDPEARKQAGISFFLVDLATPGIKIRPILDIAGHEEFCEVFFDDVRVPADHLVGKLNEGWTVAKSLLEFERLSLGSPKLAEYGLQMLVRAARKTQSDGDAVFRDRLAALQLDVAHLADAYAGFAGQLVRGETLGAEVSLLKIWATETFQRIADLTLEVAGPLGALVAGDTQVTSRFDPLGAWYKARPASIYGGSNEIQRNIIARQVLNLPKG